MARICKRCRRANPTEAAFCYHDGTHLEEHGDGVPIAAALDIGGRKFAAPFLLPSGRECNNFNELVVACRQEPEGALAALKQGSLEAFLGTQGRADLALAAHAAAAATDPPRALDEFIARLPGSELIPPRLVVDRPVIDLGELRPGESRRVELELRNEGMRLLQGAATANDAPWLILGEKPGLKRRIYQFLDRTTLVIRVRGRQVRAYPKPQEGEVVLESNGGTVTVLIRFMVHALPFPDGVLTGATTPRQLAEKALAAPREAAELVENGAVARWYQTNGWIYPVSGPAASGPAAVQQLFESIGVTRPSRVEISEDVVNISGNPGGMIEHVLVVLSQDTRPAVAHATSDKEWLQVGKTIYRSRSAMLPLTVPFIPSRPGERLKARVTVFANGGQRFVVPVALTIRGDPLPVARVTVAARPTVPVLPTSPAATVDVPAPPPPPLPPVDFTDMPTLPPGVRVPGLPLFSPPSPRIVLSEPPVPVAMEMSVEPLPQRRSLRPFLLGFGMVLLWLLLAVGIKEGLQRRWFQDLWQSIRRAISGEKTHTALPERPRLDK